MFILGVSERGDIIINRVDPIIGNIAIPITSNTKFLHVDTKGDHTAALDIQGSLHVCGDNKYGQLGLGDNIDRHTLTRVNSTEHFAQVACGKHHTVALDLFGCLHACGDNKHGQLGTNHNTSLTQFTPIDKVTKSVDSEPVAVSSDSETIRFSQVACGDDYTMALDIYGNLYCCGNNKYGQLALGDNKSRNVLTRADTHIQFLHIACGYRHMAALDTYGHLHVCGRLALDNRYIVNRLTSILSPTKFIQVSCGAYGTVVLDTYGNLHGCGYNENIKMPGHDVCDVLSLKQSHLNNKFLQVSCGEYYTVVLTVDKKIVCYGYDGYHNNISIPGSLSYYSIGMHSLRTMLHNLINHDKHPISKLFGVTSMTVHNRPRLDSRI